VERPIFLPIYLSSVCTGMLAIGSRRTASGGRAPRAGVAGARSRARASPGAGRNGAGCFF